MILLRGTSIPKDFNTISQLFKSLKKSGNTNVMEGLPETLSFQVLSKGSISGFDLFQFAYRSMDGYDPRKPVIVGVNIDLEGVFEKYKSQMWVILEKGHEGDITKSTVLTTTNAFPISLEGFSFQDFQKYSGEVLIARDMILNPEVLAELGISFYELEGNSSYEFEQKMLEDSISPPILTWRELQSLPVDREINNEWLKDISRK